MFLQNYQFELGSQGCENGQNKTGKVFYHSRLTVDLILTNTFCMSRVPTDPCSSCKVYLGSERFYIMDGFGLIQVFSVRAQL